MGCVDISKIIMKFPLKMLLTQAQIIRNELGEYIKDAAGKGSIRGQKTKLSFTVLRNVTSFLYKYNSKIFNN